MSNRALPYLLTASTLLLAAPALAAPPDDEGGWFEVQVETETDAEDEAEPDDGGSQAAEPAEASASSAPEAAVVAEEADAPREEAAAPAEPARASRERPRSELPAAYWTSHKKYLKPIAGAAPPPGYVEGKRNLRGLWGGGIGVSAATYALNLVTSILAASVEGDEDILRFGSFPLVGSFINASDERLGDGFRGLSGALGVGQLIGFGMIVGGVSARVPTWRREARGGGTSAAIDLDVSPLGAKLDVSF